MRNTTKLKHILQLYVVSLDMDEEEKIELTLIDKRNRSSQTFIDKSYSAVMQKAFSYMMKKIKKDEF
jgi:hypothetical protein